jgi:hypothetical protein
MDGHGDRDRTTEAATRGAGALRSVETREKETEREREFGSDKQAARPTAAEGSRKHHAFFDGNLVDSQIMMLLLLALRSAAPIFSQACGRVRRVPCADRGHICTNIARHSDYSDTAMSRPCGWSTSAQGT